MVFTVLGLIAIILIGLYRTIKEGERAIKKLQFANEFRDKLVIAVNGFFKEGEIDPADLMWIIKKSGQMQVDIGINGVMQIHHTFQGVTFNEYQVIVNTVQKLNDRSIGDQDVSWTDNCLLRHIGFYETLVTEQRKQFWNPFKWFFKGSREIIGFPIKILFWAGIISEKGETSTLSSAIFRIISGIISLIGLLASIVTIFGSWEKTLKFFGIAP